AADTARPVCVIARTVKGKGVSFMENQAGWHGTAPKPEELEKALAELSADAE
ncbi:transketolase, partial [Adlercreutzia rubneri]|nr:transketolase [Adlercreutzia rubneri]